MTPRERNHPVDASRGGADESVDRYKRGFRDGRAEVLNRPPPTPPPTGGSGRHRGGNGGSGSGRFLLFILALVLLAALILRWRT